MICDECLEEYDPAPTAKFSKYCGSACKQRAYRGRQSVTQSVTPDFTEEEKVNEESNKKEYGGSYGCPNCKHEWETRKIPRVVKCPACGFVIL